METEVSRETPAGLESAVIPSLENRTPQSSALLSGPSPTPPVNTVWMAVAADLMAIFLSLALVFRTGHTLTQSLAVAAGFALCAMISAFGGYKRLDRLRPERELSILVKATALVACITIACASVFGRAPVLSQAAIAMAIALPLLLAGRGLLRICFAWLWANGLCQQRTIVFGHDAALQVEEALRIQRYRGIRILGFLDSRTTREFAKGIPNLGTFEDAGRVLRELSPHLAIVPIVLRNDGAAQSVECCRVFQVPVITDDGIPLVGPKRAGIHEYLGPVDGDTPSRRGVLDRGLKRSVDIAFGLIGACLTLLILPFAAAAIYWDDRGPIFYRQEYIAGNGRTGVYLKLRTMHVNATDVLSRNPKLRSDFEENFKLKHDPRVTRVGAFLRRYSIDELPQFFSIVAGNMSLVGPRAKLTDEPSRYGPAIEKVLGVKPGLTGFWQVMGRQTTTYAERIQMDLFYVDRQSFWLDLFIVIKTIWKVMSAEGAY